MTYEYYTDLYAIAVPTERQIANGIMNELGAKGFKLITSAVLSDGNLSCTFMREIPTPVSPAKTN